MQDFSEKPEGRSDKGDQDVDGSLTLNWTL
jgi:hypothetical protein